MNKKTLYLLAAIALLLACTPAFADGAFADGPGLPQTGCSNELTTTLPWLDLAVCPQSFCTDDAYCRSICPSDPGAVCNLSTGTCTYSSGGGGTGGGGCTHNATCYPGRFCRSNSDCASCVGGCSGYCGANGRCLVI